MCNYLCSLVGRRQRGGGDVCIGQCVCVCVYACKSKFEREGACVFACASAGGTLFRYTIHAFDIPAPPVSVYKGLSPRL